MTAFERFEIVLSAGALNDLADIRAYMTEVRGPDDATALITALLDRVEALTTFPHRGAMPKETWDLEKVALRQTIHAQYRIVYFVIGLTVRVVLIADGRRDMSALLRDRNLAP